MDIKKVKKYFKLSYYIIFMVSFLFLFIEGIVYTGSGSQANLLPLILLGIIEILFSLFLLAISIFGIAIFNKENKYNDKLVNIGIISFGAYFIISGLLGAFITNIASSLVVTSIILLIFGIALIVLKLLPLFKLDEKVISITNLVSHLVFIIGAILYLVLFASIFSLIAFILLILLVFINLIINLLVFTKIISIKESEDTSKTSNNGIEQEILEEVNKIREDKTDSDPKE